MSITAHQHIFNTDDCFSLLLDNYTGYGLETLDYYSLRKLLYKIIDTFGELPNYWFYIEGDKDIEKQREIMNKTEAMIKEYVGQFPFVDAEKLKSFSYVMSDGNYLDLIILESPIQFSDGCIMLCRTKTFDKFGLLIQDNGNHFLECSADLAYKFYTLLNKSKCNPTKLSCAIINLLNYCIN